MVDITIAGITLAVPLFLLGAGAHDVLMGEMSLGRMLACNAAAAGFLLPWSSLVASTQRLLLVNRYVARIDDVLMQREEPTGTLPPPAALHRGIEFENVRFQYGGSREIIRGVSFAIRPGEVVAIVGPSGAGKSTIAKLLLGLYAADGVTVEGVPLRDYRISDLRRAFGVVLQESTVLAGTIQKNIAFNQPDVSLEAVQRAAALACIADDIEGLPLGYETRISENGGNFSGGQRQRICLARALAHQPVFLLLDEATSEIDTETEARIHRNLRALRIPTLVIAHRLATVRDADRILVVDDGVIVESGTHDQLVQAAGRYARLTNRLH